MTRLNEKAAVITGGGGVIGRTIARLFRHEGARVLLVDNDESRLTKAADEITASGIDHCCADVSTEAGVRCYTERANDLFGRIDVLILNAGVLGPVAPITDYPVEAFDAVMAVNLRAAWLGLKYAMPIMPDGASIVLTASMSGAKAAANMSAYGASKHAVIGLMRSAAVEGASRGIRVNAVAPGPIDSTMMESIETAHDARDPERAHSFIAGRIPLGRYGRPEEVAQMMVFLAGEESSFSTGGVFAVDGGITAK